MGSITKPLQKVTEPINKAITKVVPKPLKPFVPYLAGAFAPALPFAGTGIMATLAREGLTGTLANVLAQEAVSEGEDVDLRKALISGIARGGGEAFKVAGQPTVAEQEFIGAPTAKQDLIAGVKEGALKTGQFLRPEEEGLSGILSQAKSLGTQVGVGATIDAYDAAKLAEEEYDKMLLAAGKAEEEDMAERVGYIRRYLGNAGFGSDKINEVLSRYGYLAAGGRVEKKDGGIMNLQMGGMPAEMDLRPGGFVPIGSKEKADDVPARLSKNEFVMTADAVRAAGGGSVNKGAKRMYDLMHKLEAKV